MPQTLCLLLVVNYSSVWVNFSGDLELTVDKDVDNVPWGCNKRELNFKFPDLSRAGQRFVFRIRKPARGKSMESFV